MQESSRPSSPWILGGHRADLAWLFLPGFVLLLANFFITDSPGSRLFAAYFFFDAAFLGSGHIYITNWRTYMNSAERGRRSLYLWAPLLVFATFFGWRFFGLSWLAFIPAYFQAWHYMRQSFGIQKWYQRQNRSFRKASDYFTYFFCLIPFVIFHFRQPTQVTAFFLPNDLLLFPNENLLKIFGAIYAVGIAAWLIYEIRLIKYREWNRLGFVAVTAFLNGYCMLTGTNEIEILFPLVAYHGVAYFALTTKALVRTKGELFTIGRAVFAIIATALIFGFYERMIEFEPGRYSLWIESAWAGLYITPIVLHYIYDAVLWRAGHPESPLIFADTAPAYSK